MGRERPEFGFYFAGLALSRSTVRDFAGKVCGNSTPDTGISTATGATLAGCSKELQSLFAAPVSTSLRASEPRRPA